jgi:nucleoside-diphosphate-sugar epimerase
VKIFVVGATGVVGRRLVPLLAEAGHDVVGLSRTENGTADLVARGVRGVVGDVLDHERMLELLDDERPDAVVFQVSGRPRMLGPGRTQAQFAHSVLVRTVGARNVAEAARAAGTRRMIAQSYAHIYAPRTGWVKQESDLLDLDEDVPSGRRRNVEAVVALERAVRETPGLEGVALRYGTLYGPGTTFAGGGSLAGQVRIRHYPIVGGGTGWTSFLHVDDAAQAAALALDGPPGTYNICDDEPAAMHVWLPRYAAALGAPPPRSVPALAVRALGREHFAFRSTEQRAADNRWARAQLGFAPTYRTWREGFAADLAREAAA